MVVGAVVAAAAFVAVRRPPPPDPVRATALKDRAVGLLENSDLDEADRLLVELARIAPGEKLPVRDLAIARLLGLNRSGFDARRAQEAAEALIAAEPESAPACLIAARILGNPRLATAGAGDAARAQQLLERAAALAPRDAAYAYAVFAAGEMAAGQQKEKALAALRKACELEPENLFLASKLLVAQADAADPAVAKTLAALRAQLAATGGDAALLQLLDEALAAADAKNFDDLKNVAAGLANVAKADPSIQLDAGRVDPSPLNYLVFEFNGAELKPPRPPPAPALPVTFHARPPLAGSANATAARVADFDLDGAPDLLVLRPGALEVRSRKGDDWPVVATTPVAAGLTGLLVADLDGDASTSTVPQSGPAGPGDCGGADPDVLLFGTGGLAIYANDKDAAGGARAFKPAKAGAPGWAGRAAAAACLVDADHDGDLDVVDSTERGVGVWINRGDLSFADASASSQAPPAGRAFESISIADVDRDADVDLVLGGRGVPAGWLENLRRNRFRWHRLGGGEMLAIDPAPAPGLTPLDFDNDGALDLLAWSGARLELKRNEGGGRFVAVAGLPAMPGAVRDVEAADVDRDGDLDLVVATEAGVVVVENRGGNANRWLDLRFVGRADNRNRVNDNGIGSLVELKSAGGYQAQVVRAATTHFGLGASSAPLVVRVVWTSGVSQTLIDPKPGQKLCEPMVLKGSCPFAYTWNGERFEFFTDLLWASPLGLLAPDGSVVPPRPWEFLLLPGAKLRPRLGRLSVRITEELWEAAYFDHVELLAVDHPADVEVYTNEKVGPPAIAEHRIHTVRRRRTPAAVSDARGRDLLERVRHRDGRFARPFDRILAQGWTEPHHLEIDLGEVPAAERVTLFLTGWVYPGDSSLNFGFSQSIEPRGPRWPSLWALDDGGAWREVLPYMGFPGGKTKTIAVDLGGLFPGRARRLRIATSAEIAWDEVFFTAGEEPAPVKITPAPLASARLWYRGFSAQRPGAHGGPETFDHAEVDRAPRWPAMEGGFTEYGDVLERVTAADGRLVVMGSGDEMALEYAAPPPPRAGWKRDWVLHSVGWDKDADVNTIGGQSTAPLPAAGAPQTRRAAGARFWTWVSRRDPVDTKGREIR